MSQKEMQQRQADMMATRRAALTGEDRAAFDHHYGKLNNTRHHSSAGKGDADRPVDKELYDAGYLATYGETEEIRNEALVRWHALKAKKFGLKPGVR